MPSERYLRVHMINGLPLIVLEERRKRSLETGTVIHYIVRGQPYVGKVVNKMGRSVKWKQWKTYSGPVIHGTQKVYLPSNHSHWDRAVWLTSQVETGGVYGSTVAYDGTANTSGIIQAIGVYPRELAHPDNSVSDGQGPLWKLLEYVKKDAPQLLSRLEDEFIEIGWEIRAGKIYPTSDGLSTGLPINGRNIRNELTPIDGKVPRYGTAWQEAKNWVLIFHDIFSDPKSFPSQFRFGIEHLQATAKRTPLSLNRKSIESLLYKRDLSTAEQFSTQAPLDLALCILFSNSINAPAIAFQRLSAALKVVPIPSLWNSQREIAFSKALVRSLGTADYGRWNFKIASGRYQRTREAAKTLWPEHFFSGPEAIMPKVISS